MQCRVWFASEPKLGLWLGEGTREIERERLEMSQRVESGREGGTAVTWSRQQQLRAAWLVPACEECGRGQRLCWLWLWLQLQLWLWLCLWLWAWFCVCLRLQLRLRRTPALQGLHTEWHLRFHFLHLINSEIETNFCSAFNFAACQC